MSQVGIKAIKDGIKSLLDGANSLTGSPIDLSLHMTNRVQKVLTLNVEKLPVQPDFFPCVTVFCSGKDVELYDLSMNQAIGRRKGMLTFTIVGLVWIDDINTANFEITDLADNECEYLMENVEEVLRSDPTLGGNCLSSHPTAITYHNFAVQEDAHMRAGVLSLEVRTHY